MCEPQYPQDRTAPPCHVRGALFVIDDHSSFLKRKQLLAASWNSTTLHQASDRALCQAIAPAVELLFKGELVPEFNPVLVRVNVRVLELELLIRL